MVGIGGECRDRVWMVDFIEIVLPFPGWRLVVKDVLDGERGERGGGGKRWGNGERVNKWRRGVAYREGREI
jgi:hypothetical protein